MSTIPLSHTSMYSKYVGSSNNFVDNAFTNIPPYRGCYTGSNVSKMPLFIVIIIIALLSMLFMTFKSNHSFLSSSCPTKRGVKHLTTKEQLLNFMNSPSESTVMFYAPWCGHCAAAKPEFEKAAQTSSNMALCNADPSPSPAGDGPILNAQDLQKLNIEGFPTVVKYGPNGNGSKVYNGSRTSASFQEFVNN